MHAPSSVKPCIYLDAFAANKKRLTHINAHTAAPLS